MQDEVNEKTIALYIKTGKLTAQTLQKAMKAILLKGKKELSKPPQGKQSLKLRCGGSHFLPPFHALYLFAPNIKLLRRFLCCGKDFTDRGLFLALQFLAENSLKAAVSTSMSFPLKKTR